MVPAVGSGLPAQTLGAVSAPMPWHPPSPNPGSRSLRSAWPWGVIALGPALPAGLAPLDIGLAIYFVAAEVIAWFGSSMEVALEHFSRSAVLEMAGRRDIEDETRKRLERVPVHALTARFTRFLGNALLVLGVAFVAFRKQLAEGQTGGPTWVSIAGALIVVFVLVFVVNDVLVRVLARREPDRMMLRGLPVLAGITALTTPLRAPALALIQAIFRVRLIDDALTAREEVRESLEEGEREGTFSSEEAEMIGSIIDLKAETVSDVLTPRAELVMIQEDASLEEAIQLVHQEGFSRIPVYRKDKDDVIGLLYAHDLLRHWPNGEEANPVTAKTMMREAFFVPESKLLPDLLREMRTGKMHMAIVLDEFNGTVGVATIEDILEQIVGEIDDEYDEHSEPAPASATWTDGQLLVEGRTPIEDLNKELDVTLPIEEDCETIGGLVFHRLGKVPEEGDRIEVDEVALTVLEADERTVKRLQIELGKAG